MRRWAARWVMAAIALAVVGCGPVLGGEERATPSPAASGAQSPLGSTVTNANLREAANAPDRYTQAPADLTGEVVGTQQWYGGASILLVEVDHEGGDPLAVHVETPRGAPAIELGSTIRAHGVVSHFESLQGTAGLKLSLPYIKADDVAVLSLADGSAPAPAPSATAMPEAPTPVTEPPVTESPVVEPALPEPSAAEPPVTEPPASESPAAESPAIEPSATEPTVAPADTPEALPTEPAAPAPSATPEPTERPAPTRTPTAAPTATAAPPAAKTPATPLGATPGPATPSAPLSPTPPPAPTRPLAKPAATAPAPTAAAEAPAAPTSPPRFAVQPDPEGGRAVRFEAEELARDAGFAVGADPGGAGRSFIEARSTDQGWDGLGPPPPDTGQASAVVDVPEAGRYAVWVRMRYDNLEANSVWLRIDDGKAIKVGNEDGGYGVWKWVGWQDDQPSRRIAVDLDEGEHRITLIGREAGAAVDAVLVTSDLKAAPND